MKRKNIYLTIGLLTLLVVVCLGGRTLSWFQQEKLEVNQFSLGDVLVTLEEEEWDPADGYEMMPGDTVIKDPKITWQHGEMYMRLIMTIHKVDASGEPGEIITDEERLKLIFQTMYLDPGHPESPRLVPGNEYRLMDLAEMTAAGELVQISRSEMPEGSFFALDTKLSGEGVYYYNYTENDGIFGEANQGVPVYFMTNLVVPRDFGEDELQLLGRYKLVFRVQTIQSESLASMEEAFTVLNQRQAGQQVEGGTEHEPE